MKPGDLIMNEFGALAEVGERVNRDPRWKCSGWRITKRPTVGADGFGHSQFLPDDHVASWRPAPMSWDVAPRTGGTLVERWTTTPDGRWWRELRPRRLTGCCDSCGGTGTSDDASTSGKCWDCRGTGHPHDGVCPA